MCLKRVEVAFSPKKIKFSTSVCITLQAYIESDIQKYSPAPGDLAYPEKLIIVSMGVHSYYFISFSSEAQVVIKSDQIKWKVFDDRRENWTTSRKTSCSTVQYAMVIMARNLCGTCSIDMLECALQGIDVWVRSGINMKIIRAKEGDLHFTCLGQFEQHGIIAKHLTYRNKILWRSDVFVATAVLASY